MNKKIIILSMAIAIFITGCGNQPKEISNEVISGMESMIAVMDRVGFNSEASRGRNNFRSSFKNLLSAETASEQRTELDEMYEACDTYMLGVGYAENKSNTLCKFLKKGL